MLAKNLPDWHRQVCEREQYVCRVCKKDYSYDLYFDEKGVNQYLTGHHHPHTQKARPDLVLDINNGVPLCKECHTKVHKGLIEIPDREVEEKEPPLKKEKLTSAEPVMYDHILPSGRGIRLRANEKLCKCKKYVAQEVSGFCMACEKRPAPLFKKEKDKKAK